MSENDDELLFAYVNIQQDPRYHRLICILSPDLSLKGAKQFTTNYLDPGHIPIIGTVIHAYRATKRTDTKHLLENAKKDSNNEEVRDALDHMGVGAQVAIVREEVSTAMGVIFFMIPITNLLPGVNTAVGVVAKIVVNEAAKAAVGHEQHRQGDNELEHEKQEQQDPKKEDHKDSKKEKKKELKEKEEELKDSKRDDKETAAKEMPKVVDSWGAARAFLMYLGYPKTEDPVYQLWESSRLKLKSVYGAPSDLDLWTHKPSKETKKLVKSKLSSGGGGELNLKEMGTSLLELLWISYECDDLPYYNRLLERPNNKKHHIKDERYAQRIKNAVNKNVIQLNASHVPMIVTLLVQDHNAFGPKSPRWKAIFGDSDSAKEIEAMKWFLEKLTKYFVKNQEVWGFANSEADNRLEAVLFWEPPENDFSLSWLITKGRAKGLFKMGPTAYGHLVDKFSEEKDLRQKLAEEKAAVIHYVAVNDSLDESQTKEAAKELLRAIVESADPMFALIYHGERAEKFLKAVDFQPVVTEKKDLQVMRRSKHAQDSTK